MLFIRNKIVLQLAYLSLFLIGPAWLPLYAEEQPGHLTIIPDSGLIILNNDTLPADTLIRVEVPPGEQLLRFFPLHTADRWAHRYIEYPFTLGSQGHRSIDLTRRSIFSFYTDPQSADLIYHDRFLGRTPGEYLFLTGVEDSVLVKMNGFQTKVIQLDQVFEHGTDLFITLEPDKTEAYIDQLSPDEEYRSPIRAILSPDLMLSLGTGVALLATGVYFNRPADKHYDRYLRLIGSKARENAYSQARRNDRISKTTFISGDLALGFFGYLLIRRYVFKSSGPKTLAQKHRGLSFQATPLNAGVSFEF